MHEVVSLLGQQTPRLRLRVVRQSLQTALPPVSAGSQRRGRERKGVYSCASDDWACLSPTRIAKQTCAKRGEVTAALAVAGSDLARAATVRYDVRDLTQAASAANFEDDPEAVKALVVAAKNAHFDHTAQRLRDARAGTAERARVADELRAAGTTVIERPCYGEIATDLQRLTDADGAQLTEDTHRGCPGHAAYVATLSAYITPGANRPPHDEADPLNDPDDVDPAEADDTGQESRPVWRPDPGPATCAPTPPRTATTTACPALTRAPTARGPPRWTTTSERPPTPSAATCFRSTRRGPAPRPSAGRGCANC